MDSVRRTPSICWAYRRKLGDYPQTGFETITLALLFVSNVLRGSRAVQGKHLQLPFDRDGRWLVAHGFVVG
jgi:hypothetical protein